MEEQIPLENITERKNLLMNILNIATDLPYNRIDVEVGHTMGYCLEHGHGDRVTLGACMKILWDNHIDKEDKGVPVEV